MKSINLLYYTLLLWGISVTDELSVKYLVEYCIYLCLYLAFVAIGKFCYREVPVVP